jgi:hypothetical protein
MLKSCHTRIKELFLKTSINQYITMAKSIKIVFLVLYLSKWKAITIPSWKT